MPYSIVSARGQAICFLEVFLAPPQRPPKSFANHNCSRCHISDHSSINYAVFTQISGNIVIIAQITHIPDVFDSIYLSSFGCP